MGLWPFYGDAGQVGGGASAQRHGGDAGGGERRRLDRSHESVLRGESGRVARHIVAPFSGRVSRRHVSIGSLITGDPGATSGTELTAQYPEVAPPTIEVTASYPGASAEVLSKTVATPLGTHRVRWRRRRVRQTSSFGTFSVTKADPCADLSGGVLVSLNSSISEVNSIAFF
jgi:hypothetical protein